MGVEGADVAVLYRSVFLRRSCGVVFFFSWISPSTLCGKHSKQEEFS